MQKEHFRQTPSPESKTIRSVTKIPSQSKTSPNCNLNTMHEDPSPKDQVVYPRNKKERYTL